MDCVIIYFLRVITFFSSFLLSLSETFIKKILAYKLRNIIHQTDINACCLQSMNHIIHKKNCLSLNISFTNESIEFFFFIKVYGYSQLLIRLISKSNMPQEARGASTSSYAMLKNVF